jgi:hypothetical protein
MAGDAPNTDRGAHIEAHSLLALPAVLTRSSAAIARATKSLHFGRAGGFGLSTHRGQIAPPNWAG